MATKQIVYEYKEKNTGRVINSDNIVADDTNGVLECISGASFRFIPKDNLSKEPVAADYGYEEGAMPTIPAKPDTRDFDGTTPGTSTVLGTYYDYAFGINKIDIKQTKPKNVSGFVTQLIDIGTCEYIELAAKVSGGTAPIEYSIIDGNDETPIQPNDLTRVVQERLFKGLNTRFEIDTNESIIVYKDGVQTTLSYNDRGSFDFNSNIYTVTYTPKPKAFQYFPKNKRVSVKIVQRHDILVPATIESIVLVRYGGDRIWNM